MDNKEKGRGIPKNKLNYNDPMLLLEIEGLARDGYDDCQIAEILDVARETFCRNKKKKQADGSLSHLSQSLARGRRPLSVLVENALYKRAIGGYTLKTTTKRWVLHPDGTQTDIQLIQEVETEVAGDVSAQIKWLQTHKPDVYNVQPERVDITTKGKELTEPPRILKIEHVTINSDQVAKHVN
jgi:hypothetical protein